MANSEQHVQRETKGAQAVAALLELSDSYGPGSVKWEIRPSLQQKSTLGFQSGIVVFVKFRR